jgi:hypothetical protein
MSLVEGKSTNYKRSNLPDRTDGPERIGDALRRALDLAGSSGNRDGHGGTPRHNRAPWMVEQEAFIGHEVEDRVEGSLSDLL